MAVDVQKLIARDTQLKADRGTWEAHWQEITDRIYPKRSDFTTERSPGEKRQIKIYDSTPVHANELLASGLHGMMTNPATKWFSLTISDPALQEDQEVSEWLNTVTRIMFEEINDPAAGFTTAIHEFYMDFGAICTAVLFIGEREKLDGLRFATRSVAEVKIVENADGHVDTFFRRYKMTVSQMLEKWPAERLSDKVKKLIDNKKLDTKVEILHVIAPRRERNDKKKTADHKPVMSVYIEFDNKHLIQESGFDEQAMMAARFAKASGSETYGRGPGVSTLPDVKMLNEMMKTTIKAAQKIVDPPLFVEDDSVIGPLRSIPAGINYFRRGAARPETLKTGGRIDLSEAMMDGIRARIRESFFVDQLQLNIGPQMTATEVTQRTEEKLRLMGPILGRLQTELLGPLIDRVYGILQRQGKFPTPPDSIVNKKTTPEYESPLSRAQRQLEANGLLRTLETMGPLLDRDPAILDNFDADFISRHTGMSLFGVDPRFFREEARVSEIREQRAEEAQQKAQLENAQLEANANQANANAEAAGG